MAKTDIINNKSIAEMQDMLREEREHLRDLRFRLSGARLKNVGEIRSSKKKIAQLLTALSMKEKEQV